MKAVGLITEYNPFHNGHLYLIEEARRITGADCVVVVMSGDFVQRGTPAVMDKYLRASAALSCGADLVFELPVCYATGSAEFFAEGAIRLLDSLGIVDCICFGSECGDISILSETASILISEPTEYRQCLKEQLKCGSNFAKARAEAFRLTFPMYAKVLDTPNNILGIEYIKALQKIGSSIKPYTIRRKGHAYHDTECTHSFASASAVRRLMTGSMTDASLSLSDSEYSNPLKALELYVPQSALNLYASGKNKVFPVTEDDFSAVLYYSLCNKSAGSALSDYFEVNTELDNRISKLLPGFRSFSHFAMLLKNKSCTYSRICRGLLHILLDIKSSDLSEYCDNGWIFYNRLLGMRNSAKASEALGLIAKLSSVPLLTTVKNTTVQDALSEDTAKRMLKTDIAASDIYEHISSIKYAREPLPEATRVFLKI